MSAGKSAASHVPILGRIIRIDEGHLMMDVFSVEQGSGRVVLRLRAALKSVIVCRHWKSVTVVKRAGGVLSGNRAVARANIMRPAALAVERLLRNLTRSNLSLLSLTTRFRDTVGMMVMVVLLGRPLHPHKFVIRRAA